MEVLRAVPESLQSRGLGAGSPGVSHVSVSQAVQHAPHQPHRDLLVLDVGAIASSVHLHLQVVLLKGEPLKALIGLPHHIANSTFKFFYFQILLSNSSNSTPSPSGTSPERGA